ncbi:MAG: RCC1 repeat-containing protein, partial [Chloroflexota bacterium]
GGLVFASLSAGFHHTCGVTTSGAAYCWGLGSTGELGQGAAVSSLTPVPVASPGGTPLTWASVSAGSGYTCGVTTSGVGYCWGSNGSGALGTGNNFSSSTPVPVSGGHKFAAITAATNGFSCGLTLNGTALCWGNGAAGALGDGTRTSKLAPVAVSGGLTFSLLDAGGNHTCGLAGTGTGAAYCWGANVDGGKLGSGSGTFFDSPVPLAVVGGLNFAQVSAGRNHTCGVTTTNAAYCWGSNSHGQIGNGGSIFSAFPSPAAVSGGLGFLTVSAGGFHTCGVTTSQATYCWGAGALLGNGTTTASNTPVAVSDPQ